MSSSPQQYLNLGNGRNHLSPFAGEALSLTLIVGPNALNDSSGEGLAVRRLCRPLGLEPPKNVGGDITPSAAAIGGAPTGLAPGPPRGVAPRPR